MKRSRWLWVFAAEAAACAVLCAAQPEAALLQLLFSLPFSPLGRGLRALSLSGAVGNLAAILLYLVFCLLPTVFFVLRLRKRGFSEEALLLPVMSVSLFFVLYAMINHNALPFPQASLSFRTAMLGGLIWAEAAAYVLLRLLRGAFHADKTGLRRYLRGIVLLLAALFVYSLFAGVPQSLMTSLQALHTANTNGAALLLSEVFLVLRALADAVPLALDLWVCAAALAFLRARQQQDPEAADALAARLAARCRASLTVSVLLSLALYLLQLLFASRLRTLDLNVPFPLLSLAFCLAALLLTRLVQENRQLREDNDLFI